MRNLLFLGMAFFSTGAFPLAFPVAYSMPAQVLLIRHAEKPESGNDLSEQGYARAKALPAFFTKNPVVNRFGPIAAVYAMKAASEDSSNRPVETVIPTAKTLGLIIHAQYPRKIIVPLVSEIKNSPELDGKTVLICWEHKMIPLIAQEFGFFNAPTQWDGHVFNQVWALSLNPMEARHLKF
jgi:hypothetical protein